jgi:hypothetical protein
MGLSRQRGNHASRGAPSDVCSDYEDLSDIDVSCLSGVWT